MTHAFVVVNESEVYLLQRSSAEMSHSISNASDYLKQGLFFSLTVMNSENTQTFEIKSDQLASSTSLLTDGGCDDYLRMAIGQPLSDALAFVVIHRPEDAIEFLARE